MKQISALAVRSDELRTEILSQGVRVKLLQSAVANPSLDIRSCGNAVLFNTHQSYHNGKAFNNNNTFSIMLLVFYSKKFLFYSSNVRCV
jgi:hypothetical protein